VLEAGLLDDAANLTRVTAVFRSGARVR